MTTSPHPSAAGTGSGTGSVVTGQLRTAGGVTATLHAPAGASALVVLSHGLYLSHHSWSGCLEHLAEQITGSRTIAVLAYDHRGHGSNAALAAGSAGSVGSADPAGSVAGSAVLDLATLAGDLDEILRAAWAHLGQIPTVLVGHSLGSMAALTGLASGAIDRSALAGLVLVSSSPGGLTGSMLLRLLPAVAGRAPGLFATSQRIVRCALSPVIGPPDTSGAPGGAPHAEAADEPATPTGLSAVAAAQLLGSLGAYDVADRLSSALTGLATEVLCGGADRITPVTHSRRICDAVRTARLTVLDGAGHSLPTQAPLPIVGAVTRLLTAA